MRSVRFVAGLLVACSASAVRADEVVLDNGRVVVGRVVSEDERAVKVAQRDGTLTFERSRVREIRRKPVPEDPATAPASSTSPAGRGAGPARDAKAPAPSRTDEIPPEALDRPPAPDAPELIEKMKAIRLESWTSTPDDEFDVPPDVGMQWRIERTDGTVTHAANAPRTREGIRAVWAIDRRLAETLRRAKEMVLRHYGQAPPPHEAVWWRAEWDPAANEWLRGPRGRRLLADENGLAAQTLYQLGRPDVPARGEAHRTAAGIVKELERSKDADVTEQRAKLVAICRRLSKDDGGARILARVFELHLTTSPDPQPEHVELARERRELLIRFVTSHRPAAR